MRLLRHKAFDRRHILQTHLLILLVCLIGFCANPVDLQAQSPNHHVAIIAALREGRVRDAYQLLESIETPRADDLLPLSMGVRLMLDHLYLVDATDLEMPSLRAQMDRALSLADKAIAADRGAAEGWGVKALALNWAYRSQEALTLVRSARAQHPDDAGLMVVEAEVLAQMADYSAASVLLDEAIALLRADSGKAAVARAFYVRGNIAQILGQREQAITAYEAAWNISRQPYDETRPWNVVPPGYILYQLGPIYLFEGRAADALDVYTVALSIDRQDAFLFYLRGRVYRFQGQLDGAAAEFGLCLDAEPQQWRCMRNLGQMAYERGDWQATIQWFAPVVSANSQISDDHYYLAAAYRAIGRCTLMQSIWESGWSLLQTATGQPYWNTEAFLSIREGC